MRTTQNAKLAHRLFRNLCATVVSLSTVVACSDDLSPTQPAEPKVSLSVSGTGPYVLAGPLASATYQNITFGVNGHPSNNEIPKYAVEASIDEQLRVARGLGASMYRIDVAVQNSSNPANAPVILAHRAIEAINLAAVRGMQTVVVLTNRPPFSVDTGSARQFGRDVANQVINQVLLPANVAVAAVELGNELDVPALPCDTCAGDDAAGYSADSIARLRSYYQGLREAFMNHADSRVRTVTRLLNSSFGHMYWIDMARKNWVPVWRLRKLRWVLVVEEQVVVPISATSVDQISWHWYHNMETAEYAKISEGWFGGREPIISMLRGRFGAGNFQLWITEFNRINRYPQSYAFPIAGDCPLDAHTINAAPKIELLLRDFVSLPETKAVIVYEAYDQSNYETRLEERFGLVVRGCAAGAPDQIIFKQTADAFTRTTLELRDERTALAHTTLALLTEGEAISSSDSTYAAQAVATIGARADVRLSVDNANAKSLWIANMYRRIHRREPDAGGMSFWLSVLGQPGYDRHKVEGEAYASDEYWINSGSNNYGYVVALYRDIQHRDGGAEGNAYWVWRLENGTSRFEVARSFLASPENITNVVNRTHQIAFGRQASQAELDFWLPQLYYPAMYEEMVEHLLKTTEMSLKSRERRIAYLRQGF